LSLIVSIETSTKVCSVALHKNGELLGDATLWVAQSHSVMLTSLIENVVTHAQHTLEELDAIALGKGPGSYTGLRIGTATAKGLCFALDKPLVAVNSLHAMAAALQQTAVDNHWFCPMIDARRMEVYCAIYDQHLQEQQATEAKIIDAQSFEDILSTQKVVFFGDGAAKCKEVLGNNSNALFVDNFHPTARSVGQLAHHAFNQGQTEDIAYFEPFYLKDFVALKPTKKFKL
jgi:tRNA threonylcarbamoyladenosine biosynthesis protein TsaB